ncbi:hypothetical protein ACIQUU_15130 [Streptomyces sp. NPDC101116]
MTSQDVFAWVDAARADLGHWIIQNTVRWTTDVTFAEPSASSPATAPLPS